MESNIEKPERVVLAGVHTGANDVLNDTTDESIKELALLVETAGGEVIGEFVQNRSGIDHTTYVGEGKVQEIKQFCKDNEIDTVIFDDELSGAQIRNLERELDIKVTDRSALIMDIFAQRAQTKEGKIQVELAQLRYLLPRLSGSSDRLSRLGGGIGTRGPGETKLESDRRHIRNRIAALSDQLDEVIKNREIQRHTREKEEIWQVAIIGYTNAGKSTLLNYLTQAGVLAEDKLFATLDPTARRLTLEDATQLVMIDTVGFVRKLPHHLIKAFRSTLEEATIADLLVHVVDCSSSEAYNQIIVVEKLLDELGATDKPILTVFNKKDLITDRSMVPPVKNSVWISAKSGDGVDEMLKMIKELLPETMHRLQVLIPYNQGHIVSAIYEKAVINCEEHTEKGTKLDITIDHKLLGMVDGFLVDADLNGE